MANGQPGIADSMFKLANQRSAALAREQQRKANQDNIRRQDINTLSGFNASAIEGDAQRAIFEQMLSDTQNFIAGTGKYEDAEYDPVAFRTKINSISSLYNGFAAHNAGDVSTARNAYNDDAHTEGGVPVQGEGSLGMRVMSNNTPSSYESAVDSHNNYFEPYQIDGEYQFDANGHPMGFPVIDGVVDYESNGGQPISAFKMEAYANPTNFEGQTVEVALPTTSELTLDKTNALLLARHRGTLSDSEIQGKSDREVHGMAVSKFLDDKLYRPGQEDFREAMLVDLIGQGKFPPEDETLQQAFVSGDFENPDLKKLMEGDKGLKKSIESLYADKSYSRPAPSEPKDEDSPYIGSQRRGTGDSEYEIKTFEPIAMDYSQFVPEGGSYDILGVGVNKDGQRVASIAETTASLDPVTEEETTTITTRTIPISSEGGGQGREIYDTLRESDPRILADLNAGHIAEMDRRRALGLPKETVKEEPSKLDERISEAREIVMDTTTEGGQRQTELLEKLNDDSPYDGPDRAQREAGLTVAEAAAADIAREKAQKKREDERVSQEAVAISPTFTAGGPGMGTGGGTAPFMSSGGSPKEKAIFADLKAAAAKKMRELDGRGEQAVDKRDRSWLLGEEARLKEKTSAGRAEGLQKRMTSATEEIDRLPIPQGENLWNSSYGDPSISSKFAILDPSATVYDDQLAAASKVHGPPPADSPHYEAYQNLDKAKYGIFEGADIVEQGKVKTPPGDLEKRLKVEPVKGKGYNASKEAKEGSFDAAVEILKVLGHPYPEAAAAQAALESDWGASGLAKNNNNFFGMKPGSVGGTQKALNEAGVEFNIQGYTTEEVVNAKTLEKFKKKYGDDMKIIKNEGGGKTRVEIPGEPFLVFPTPEEGFKGYMAWIEYNMGDSLQVDSGKEYLQFLHKNGYATSPDYVNHIISRANSAGRSIEKE